MVRSWLPEKGGGRRYNVLQVCYSMSRARYSVLQRVTGASRACYSMLQRVTGGYGRATACYGCVTTCYSVFQRVTGILQLVTACYVRTWLSCTLNSREVGRTPPHHNLESICNISIGTTVVREWLYDKRQVTLPLFHSCSKAAGIQQPVQQGKVVRQHRQRHALTLCFAPPAHVPPISSNGPRLFFKRVLRSERDERRLLQQGLYTKHVIMHGA